MGSPPVMFGRNPGVLGVTPWSGIPLGPPPPGTLQPVGTIIRPLQSPPPPDPSSRWVTGFPRDADSTASLALPQRIRLRLFADWIVACHQPGAYPVVKITAVGHAEAREPYARAVSWKRASSVLEELRLQIRSSALEDRNWAVLNPPSPDTTIEFQTRPFSSIANKRAVELIFERGQYVVPPASPFNILQATEQVMQWAKYRFPPPPELPPRWWRLPSVTRRNEWREIVNFMRNETILKYLDLKTIVDGMWKATQGDPAPNPNASHEHRQSTVEKWAEGLAEAEADFRAGLQERTNDPPRDLEEPEPTIFIAPSFAKGPDQTVPEDAGPQSVPDWATHIGGVPPLTFEVTGNTYPRLFSAGPAVHAVRSAGGDDTGTLTYTPATHAYGSATITVVLRDHGSNAPPHSNISRPRSFTITVTKG